MEIRIIKYQSEDYLKAIQLREKILRLPLGLTLTKEFLEQDKEQYHFALFENERILSSLTYKIMSETSIKMRQVATDKHLQGRGLGKKLVLYSEEYMKKKGYSHIILHARDSAIIFYDKLNYISFGEEFEEVGLPHIKMEKYI